MLDLGCGAGIPGTKLLVEAGYNVVGIDFSSVQLKRARRFVQGATFLKADMATGDCGDASFGAVVSLYALIHLPLLDQQALFPKIRRWLRPGGFLLAIVGHRHWTGVEDYHGSPMFWDHADSATYLEWLKSARLTPLWDRFIPEGDAGHVLVLARAD